MTNRYILQANGITTIHDTLISAKLFKEQLLKEGFKSNQIKILKETKFKRKFL